MADSHSSLTSRVGISPVSFIKEVYAELSKIIWPTRQEVIRMTIIVISVSLAIGLYVGGLDLAFTKVTDILIKK